MKSTLTYVSVACYIIDIYVTGLIYVQTLTNLKYVGIFLTREVASYVCTQHYSLQFCVFSHIIY